MRKKRNPTVEELLQNGEFAMTAKLTHEEIRDFVVKQLMKGGKLVKMYMIYQLIMVTTGIYFITRAVLMAFKGDFLPLIYSLGTIIFIFTVLILIHELIHGIALKFTGAQKINLGGYLRKFIFYAEADRHVMNRFQFTVVAIAPFVVIKLLSAAGIFFFLNEPEVYIFWLIMCSHSLFCAGDLGLLSLFWQDQETEMYTFDVRENKTSYFFIRTTGNSEIRNVVQP